jgi:hypothetical protein
MTDKKEKVKWIKPQLVVIGRGRPEESVLWACKEKTIAGPEKSECGAKGGACAGLGQS